MQFRQVILYAAAVAAITGAVVAPARAQQMGVIQGQVLDASSGRPLANAQVLIEGTGIGQLSNASGRFDCPASPPESTSCALP